MLQRCAFFAQMQAALRRSNQIVTFTAVTGSFNQNIVTSSNILVSSPNKVLSFRSNSAVQKFLSEYPVSCIFLPRRSIRSYNGNGRLGGSCSSSTVIGCPHCKEGKLAPLLTDNHETLKTLQCTKCQMIFRDHTEYYQRIDNERKQMHANDSPTKTLPVPKQIDQFLSSFVIGQSHATKMLAVAVYNHYKRIMYCPRPVKQQGQQQQTGRAGQPLLPQETQRLMQQTPMHPHSNPSTIPQTTASFQRSVYDRDAAEYAARFGSWPPGYSPDQTNAQYGVSSRNQQQQTAARQQIAIGASSSGANMRRTTHEILSTFDKDTYPVRIEKANIMMIGPTGSGKTLLAQTVAECLDVPFALCDCTTLTAAGYVGEDVESLVDRLLQNAGGNVETAQQGIIFIDEVDKVSSSSNSDNHYPPDRRDVGGVAVQQALLRMVEGSVVDLGSSRKTMQQQQASVDTANILFVASGAFANLPKLIKRRRANKTIGFNFGKTLANDGEQKNEYYSIDDPFGLRRTQAQNKLSDIEIENIENDRMLREVEPRDLINYGLIPEFVGRFPVLVPFEHITEDTLVHILTEPANALVKQYREQFRLDNIKLSFTDGALRAIAKKALRSETGARSLRAVLEMTLQNAMYDLPGTDVIEVSITEDVVNKKGSYIARTHNGANQNTTPPSKVYGTSAL